MENNRKKTYQEKNITNNIQLYTESYMVLQPIKSKTKTYDIQTH